MIDSGLVFEAHRLVFNARPESNKDGDEEEEEEEEEEEDSGSALGGDHESKES